MFLILEKRPKKYYVITIYLFLLCNFKRVDSNGRFVLLYFTLKAPNIRQTYIRTTVFAISIKSGRPITEKR